VALDTTATPKTFDLHFNQGPEKGNVSLGIMSWMETRGRFV
jgi:hypothetical protein